jgi:hypothetical protein
MKGSRLPNQDHIARLCKPKTLDDDHITATAFMLREDEVSLSVNWLEFLGCSNRGEELTELREIYSRKLQKVPTRAKIAVLNVGKTCQHVFSEVPGRIIEVCHEPEAPNDYSHSGIYNLREDNLLIAELIRQTILESHPGKEIQ